MLDRPPISTCCCFRLISGRGKGAVKHRLLLDFCATVGLEDDLSVFADDDLWLDRVNGLLLTLGRHEL